MVKAPPVSVVLLTAELSGPPGLLLVMVLASTVVAVAVAIGGLCVARELLDVPVVEDTTLPVVDAVDE
jgi:hypothetical protein